MDRRILIGGILFRVVLLVIGEIQDNYFDVKYTDIDYDVYNDAAEYVMAGGSPYDRHTYRYSPIIAYMMIPNAFVGMWWGKLVFFLCDLGAGWLMSLLLPGCEKYWLLNPLVVNMSTRGSSESLIACLLILTLVLLK
jgi:phosphatidylinositol glycan class M